MTSIAALAGQWLLVGSLAGLVAFAAFVAGSRWVRHPSDRSVLLRALLALVLLSPLLSLVLTPSSSGLSYWIGPVVLGPEAWRFGSRAAASVPRLVKVRDAAVVLYLSMLLFQLGRIARSVFEWRRLLAGSEPRDGFVIAPGDFPPATLGWLRPAIVFSRAHYDTLSTEQREIALRHEKEHVRRRDSQWRALALLTRAVFWFHPLVLWLCREEEAAMELSVDSALLDEGVPARAYGELLVASAERATIVSSAPGLAKPFIHRRITHMKQRTSLHRRWLVALLWLTCFAGTWQAVRASGLAKTGEGVALYLLDEGVVPGAWKGTPVVASREFATARLSAPCTESCTLALSLRPDAATRFGAFTAKHLGSKLGLVYNGHLLSAATLKARIVSPAFEISGDLPRAEAEAVVRAISGS